jgi:hypothetical protein
MRYVAAGVAAVALAFGAYAVGNSNSSNSSNGVANASGSAPAANGQQQVPQNGQAPQGGQGPPGGFGTPVSGATAKKVEAAALAKYKGTVERVMKLDDGSYVAHVITSNGEYHVAVSKNFKVTGARQGGPGGGGGGVPGGAAPSGSSSKSDAS